MEDITKQELTIIRGTILVLLSCLTTIAGSAVCFFFFDMSAALAILAALVAFVTAKKAVDNQRDDSLKLYDRWMQIVPQHTKAREYLEKRIKYYKEKLGE